MKAKIIVVTVLLITASLSVLISLFNVYDHLDFRYSAEESYEYGIFNWHEFQITDGTSSFFYSIESSNYDIGLIIARYDSSVHSWDWPQTDVLLNVTGTEIAGRFDCPNEGHYSLIFYGVTPSVGTTGQVNYEICRVPVQSFPLILGFSIFICSAAAFLTILLTLSWRSGRALIAGSNERKPISPSQSFIVNYWNWIAIPVGAAIISIVSIIRSITILNSFGDPYVQYVNSIGLFLLVWGIVLGLVIMAVGVMGGKIRLRTRRFFIMLRKLTLGKKAS